MVIVIPSPISAEPATPTNGDDNTQQKYRTRMHANGCAVARIFLSSPCPARRSLLVLECVDHAGLEEPAAALHAERYAVRAGRGDLGLSLDAHKVAQLRV